MPKKRCSVKYLKGGPEKRCSVKYLKGLPEKSCLVCVIHTQRTSGNKVAVIAFPDSTFCWSDLVHITSSYHIYALRKARMRFTWSLKSFSSVAFGNSCNVALVDIDPFSVFDDCFVVVSEVFNMKHYSTAVHFGTKLQILDVAISTTVRKFIIVISLLTARACGGQSCGEIDTIEY